MGNFIIRLMQSPSHHTLDRATLWGCKMDMTKNQGDMQLKRNTTCEKRWKKMQQHLFRTAVGNSPLFLDESPFRPIRPIFEPRNVVLNIDEFSEMEIRPKIGVSCRPDGWFRTKINYNQSSRRQLTPNFGRIFGPRAWATL